MLPDTISHYSNNESNSSCDKNLDFDCDYINLQRGLNLGDEQTQSFSMKHTHKILCVSVSALTLPILYTLSVMLKCSTLHFCDALITVNNGSLNPSSKGTITHIKQKGQSQQTGESLQRSQQQTSKFTNVTYVTYTFLSQ